MIRAAHAGDADGVMPLLMQLAASFDPDESAFAANFPRLVADPAVVLVVDEFEGRLRGYALASISLLLYTNGKSAQLQELVVDEGERSSGIGGQLLEAVEAECRSRGARQLTVASRRASGYYSDRGYAVTADFLKKAL